MRSLRKCIPYGHCYFDLISWVDQRDLDKKAPCMLRKPPFISRGVEGWHQWGHTCVFPRGLQQRAQGNLGSRFISARSPGDWPCSWLQAEGPPWQELWGETGEQAQNSTEAPGPTREVHTDCKASSRELWLLPHRTAYGRKLGVTNSLTKTFPVLAVKVLHSRKRLCPGSPKRVGHPN